MNEENRLTYILIGGAVLFSVGFLALVILGTRGRLSPVDQKIVDLAVNEAGVEREQFIADYQSEESKQSVEKDIAQYDELAGANNRSTPAVFIEGERVDNAPYEQFRVSVQQYISQSEDGVVDVLVFEDFECPACAAFFPIIYQTKDEFKEKVNVEFKHLPLESIHPKAFAYARAAEAAKKQGKFYEFARAVYTLENPTDYSVLDTLDPQVFE